MLSWTMCWGSGGGGVFGGLPGVTRSVQNYVRPITVITIDTLIYQ